MIQVWGVESVLLDQRTVLLVVVNKKKAASWSWMGLGLFPASYGLPTNRNNGSLPSPAEGRPRAWFLGLRGEPSWQAPPSLIAKSERRPGKSLHPLHAEELMPGTR